MRELDRTDNPLTSCAIVGAGRLGGALAAALRRTGLEIDGPLGRGADPVGVDAVLLCVPDAEIAAAAAAISPGPPVGHCSGATGLDVLTGHEAFAFHPLMTVPARGEPAFDGAGAAVADEDRAAYHAAASIASNFLVTLEGAADALTGPVARGDEATVARQREAVEERAPDLLPLFDAMVDATRGLAGAPR